MREREREETHRAPDRSKGSVSVPYCLRNLKHQLKRKNTKKNQVDWTRKEREKILGCERQGEDRFVVVDVSARTCSVVRERKKVKEFASRDKERPGPPSPLSSCSASSLQQERVGETKA